MLKHLQKGLSEYKFAIEKKLFVYQSEKKDYRNNSGIRATIFGASGLLGKPIAAKLGQLGSNIIMPISNQFHFRHSQHVKQLKLVATTNKSWLQWDMNFKNQKMIEDMVKNSNVVINLVGPRKKVKKIQDFQFINIQVAERIAHAAKKYGIHRLIHFSAAGAEPNSQSLDFRTKYQAEAVVLKAFPNATIFRPCPVIGLNDYFASTIHKQLNFFFNKFNLVYDECSSKKQPIKDTDIAQCVLNALKLEQTKGKTYQLGGPHILSLMQVHEIIYNTMKIRPKLAYIKKDWAMIAAKYIYNWQFFGQQYLRKKGIDEIVKSDKYRTIDELLVEPVSFKNAIYEILREYIANVREIDESKQN